ncbi:related to COP9 signalosome subunit 4 [Cephalotrichum gorgonifer]|uniref:COP9 signalosome complex subunit 4 n=1 Tax=Cephalotrichum gorgonifer TaxID=2041049 RepID=A0AAE8MNI8_9PEZI|nr:related to COP9 signalosome subunit 4 [Cephalotrichum gorgonifer]
MAPSQKVASALAHVDSLPEPSRAAQYESILHQIKDLSSPQTAVSDLTAIATAFFSASLGIVSTRSLLDTFASTLRDIKNADMCIEVGEHVLGLTASAPSSYPDQIAALQELVAGAHESNDDFAAAARALSQIPLDESQRRVSPADVARVWVRIVRNHLEVDDTGAAEAYVNKLKNIMHTVPDDAELQLHFQLSQARIRDSKGEFLEAARRYHEVSFSKAVAEEERLHTLSVAIKCAVLAPAGPQRSRVLARLYRDERAAGLEEFGMLEKMFLDRLLEKGEVDKFAEGLAPHQLATTAHGTVLSRAVVEHNLLGASRLYANIGFEALAALLGLGADEAEDTTARMIEQGRLVGRIDQLERIIWFEKGEGSGVTGSGRAEGLLGKEMRRWDGNVQGVAEEVEGVINAIQNEFPDFVAANLRA